MQNTNSSDLRSFSFLTINQFFIQLAHSVFDISLIWLILDLTGSNAATGLVMATAYLPFLLFSLPAGVFADTHSKALILKFTSFVRILIAAGIPLIAYTQDLNIFIIASVAFSLTLFSSFYIPARDALIPEYLKDSHLFKANSAIQGSMQLAYILGPILAGFLIEVLGNIHIFFIASSLFFAATLFSLFLQGHRNTINPDSQKMSLQDLKSIFSLMKKDQRLIWILVITMIDNLFIMGPAIVGIAIFVRTVLLGSASDYALCESALAFGMVTGTLLLLRFGKNIPLGKMLIAGIFFDGLTYIPVYYLSSVKWLWITIFAHALFIPMITVSRTTLIQKLVPPALHGRIFSLVSISVIGFTAISSAFTGLASEIVPIQSLFFIIGMGGAVTGIIAWFYKPLQQL
ncbi:MAG: MFS transporter [Candidatus Marinimicrobia bacterium]|nr:MFS transporter [Candidatus Neomarinimicrobiota bacterium]